MFEGLFSRSEDGQLRDTIREVTEAVVRDALDDAADTVRRYREITRLQDTVTSLKKEIETLTIEKDRKEEDFARREREIEHKVGLEKKRSEFERDAAKREATLELREEALGAKEEAFRERMEFLTTRFEEEVTYQRDVLEKVLARLPSAEIIARIGNGGGRGGAPNDE